MGNAAYEEHLSTRSYPASGDLSAHQFKFVEINSDGQVALANAGGNPDGVLQDKPTAAGQACCVAVAGVTKVVAGAALDEGVDVTSNGSGLAVEAGSGDDRSGTTLTHGSAANSIVSIELKLK
jgi:hypothetical protein